VRAKQEGREPDAAPGLRGKQRSVHNTYFTLPVLFIMISNHYAMTYGARYNWLVLIAINFAGACIRGWFVTRHRSEGRHGLRPLLPAALGVLLLGGVVLALAPPRARSSADMPVSPGAAQIQAILSRRCLPCHSKNPTQPGFNAPPNGLMLETLEKVRAHGPEVRQQLALRIMPLGNLTGMTEEERAAVLSWIGHGMSETVH
jgi:uncharacterized membrane protein